MNTIYEDTDFESIKTHILDNKDVFKISENDIFSGEGYEFKNNDYTKPIFGTKFAMYHQLAAFYHEYAHAVDISMEEPHRLLRRSFGMHYQTTVAVFDREYEQPITYQATNRECRVMAIQAKLYAHVFGIPEQAALSETLETSSKSLLLMEDSINIKPPKEMSLKEKENYRHEFVKNLISNHFNELSIDNILKQTSTISDFRSYQNWPKDKLEKEAFHDVYLGDLSIHFPDLLNLWPDKNFHLTAQDFESFDIEKENKNEKEEHIEKIIQLQNNKKPINIKVNQNTEVFLDDESKYKVAAAFFNNKKMINAKIDGSKDDITQACLYGPNPFEIERLKRLENTPSRKKKLGM
jgi:hypothetical protein